MLWNETRPEMITMKHKQPTNFSDWSIKVISATEKSLQAGGGLTEGLTWGFET